VSESPKYFLADPLFSVSPTRHFAFFLSLRDLPITFPLGSRTPPLRGGPIPPPIGGSRIQRTPPHGGVQYSPPRDVRDVLTEICSTPHFLSHSPIRTLYLRLSPSSVRTGAPAQSPGRKEEQTQHLHFHQQQGEQFFRPPGAYRSSAYVDRTDHESLRPRPLKPVRKFVCCVFLHTSALANKESFLIRITVEWQIGVFVTLLLCVASFL